MKTIKKLKNNLGKVAGSALLVGATFATGGAMVTAQDSGSSGSLGDFPAPFVSEEGEVDTSVVVGETAQDGQPVSTLDVVSGIEIAGSLGNAAFMESEQSVDVSTAGASWSAENGVTLNRQNSNIFFPEGTAVGQTRFDGEDITSLQESSFQSENSEEVTVEHDLNIGDREQRFDNDAGDVDDPLLYVSVPTTVDADGSDSDYLFSADVEFSETMDFTEQDSGSDNVDDAADEVLEDGDEIELFGQEFTYSDETSETELVLYGSSDRFEVNTGESQTITINEQEATFEVSYVTDASGSDREATVTVDGSTQTVAESDTITVGDTEVRVSDIYRTGPDGQGRVAFSQGSDELTIDEDGNVEVDGETVDGVDVFIESNPNTAGETFSAVDGMTFAFGAEDADENYVEAGSSYEDPLFGLEFHYGGLSADTANNPAEAFEVNAEDNDNVEFTFTSEGEETTLELGDGSENTFDFGPDEGDANVAQYEGAPVSEDDYTVLNSNEEAALYEVTNVDDTDLENEGSNGDDETVAITLQNVVTGDTVEVEETGLDFADTGGDLNSAADSTALGSNDQSYTLEAESVEGKDFDITWHGADTVSFERTVNDDGSVQLWPHMYSQTDAAVAIDAPDNAVDLTDVFTIGANDFEAEVDFTTDGNTTNSDVTIDGPGSYDYVVEDASGNEVASATGASGTTNVGNAVGTGDFTVTLTNAASGSVSVTGTDVSAGGASTTLLAERTVDLPSGLASNDASATVEFSGTDTVDSVSVDNSFVQYDVNLDGDSIDLTRPNPDASAGVLVVQPEDDDDNEQAYAISASASDGSQAVDVAYKGGSDLRQTDGLDDEDVEVGYDFYGAYTALDEEDSDVDNFRLHMPAAQSTVGMAVTGADGSLSASGGSTGGSVTSMMPTYEYADGVLDSDSNVGQVQNSDNLILVGGPSVNSLVAELADEGETWTADEYTEGEGLIQHVPNAFSEGQDAVIVAGYAGEDTRAAGEFLADYRNNEGALEGNQQVTISTESGQVVN